MYLAKTKGPRKINRNRSARHRAAAKAKNKKRHKRLGIG
jgi:hypothetical protein